MVSGLSLLILLVPCSLRAPGPRSLVPWSVVPWFHLVSCLLSVSRYCARRSLVNLAFAVYLFLCLSGHGSRGPKSSSSSSSRSLVVVVVVVVVVAMEAQQ